MAGNFLNFAYPSKDTGLHGNVGKKRSLEFKDSGVQKLFVIAIAQNTQENYHNIKLIWDKSKIDEFLTKQRDGTVLIQQMQQFE